MAPALQLLPAVDVADGQAVRLLRGAAGTETSYGSPRDAALAWQRDGAVGAHGRPRRGVRARGQPGAVGRCDCRTRRRRRVVRRYPRRRLAGRGAGHRLHPGQSGDRGDREPRWCASAIAEYGDKIAVGLDVTADGDSWRLRGCGWVTEGGDLWEALARLDADGCARYVVTDVSKDGTLTGPNSTCCATWRSAPARRRRLLRRHLGTVRPHRDRRPVPSRGRGRDHRQSPLRGPLHTARGARGGARGALMASPSACSPTPTCGTWRRPPVRSWRR